MQFRIKHKTRFDYEQASYDSHNELRMTPLDGFGQRCLAFELTIDRPGSIISFDDFFGNRAHALSVSEPHQSLTITAQSLVERHPLIPETQPEVPFARFLADDGRRRREYYEFLNSSRYVPFSDRLQKFFWMAHPAGTEDVGAYVTRIVAYVRDQFEYESATTNVHSSLDDILKSGGGVCQDFAHLTIGLLRLAGVPARYISGYLAPPIASRHAATTAHQASHAWLEAWLADAGWTGFDPTHRCRTDERHIRIAVGRDYADVPPLKGVYRSHGTNQVMTVDLSVELASTPVAPGQPVDQAGPQSQQ